MKDKKKVILLFLGFITSLFLFKNLKLRSVNNTSIVASKSGLQIAKENLNNQFQSRENNIKANIMIPIKDKELFDFVFAEVIYNYVEEVEVKKLYEYAMKGLLSSLDPHSTYMDEKEFEEMKVSTKGEFGGLGIVVTKDSNFIKVVSPIDDTPAFKAGIKSGDYISKINDELTYDMTLEKAVEKMRGKPGTTVKIVILRKGENEPLEIELKREIIKVDAIKGRIEKDDIIYLKITSFIETTHKDIVAMYNKLKSSLGNKKPQGIILDLRNNPGGLLDQAVKVSELFLEKDKTIVSIKGRDDKILETYKSDKNDTLFENIPIVVLVNEGSASASEIVAGALQDHKKAVIMGTKTFGKASVQSVFPLTNGGAVKMTIARYYTPSGRSIQADGIVPDITVEEAIVNFNNKEQTIREKDLNGHLEKGKEDIVLKSIKENKKEYSKNISDYQLSKAIDLIIGINFYNNKEYDKK